MTQAYQAHRATAASDTPPRRNHRKSRLFCSRCGHENPIDGDWVLTLRPGTVEIRCPDCRTLLTVRPFESAAKERSDRSR